MRRSQASPIMSFRVLLFMSLLATVSHSSIAQVTGVASEKEKGIRLYQENHFAQALDALEQSVKLNKEDYEAWYFLGLGLTHEKDFNRATRCFETALKLQPQFAAGHAGLAYVLLLRNKLPNSAAEAEAAIRFDPTIPDAYYIIGVIRLRAGDKDKALERANETIKLRPGFAPAYLLKSEALVSFVGGDAIVRAEEESAEARKSRYREAATALEKYLELEPSDPDKELWMEQLESLRFSFTHHDGDAEQTFSGKEVTTKVRVLSKPEPTYTETARSNQISGTVILRCVFAADGTVKHFIVVKGLPDGMTEICIRAARRIKFVPATLNGRPVSMWMELQYNFELY